jgi:hypothetical protein
MAFKREPNDKQASTIRMEKPAKPKTGIEKLMEKPKLTQMEKSGFELRNFLIQKL